MLTEQRATIHTTMISCKPVTVFLNASRLDYDGALDFSRLESLCDFRRHNLDRVTDPEEMISQVEGAEIVITKEMVVPKDVFERFPSTIKLLCEAGTGYNNLPIAAARERGVLVCNVPTYSTDAVAHMAVTYLMNFSVSMFEQQRMLQDGDRSNFTGPFTLPLMELGGKTVGLIGGGGAIGSKVAEICLVLGMNVIISSRAGKLPSTHRLLSIPGAERIRVVKELDLLLEESDFVSIHCPLNDETRRSFGMKELQQMKSSSFLINASRGGILREDEIIEGMKMGIIAGAGLDVTTTEPPSPESELWGLRNVWLSPHTGWRRLETRQRLVDMTADSIEAYCKATKEEEMINIVN